MIERRNEDTCLGHAFVEAVDGFDGARVRKREHVRAQSHDIAVLPVQVDVRPLRSSAPDVKVPPPIGVGGEGMAGILVQAVVVFVPEELDHHSGYEYEGPVCTEEGEESAGQHVELRLALGKS